MVCILDIETIPHTAIVAKFFDLEGDEMEIINRAFVLQKEKSGSEFLPLPFHRVISISAVFCDEYGHFKKIGNFGVNAKKNFLQNLKNLESAEAGGQSEAFALILDGFEKELLQDFWMYFNKSHPKIISFNGRSFDMPVLYLRAMRYNISAHGFFEVNNPIFDQNKWDNYRQRYSERFHTDVLDVLNFYGSVRGMRLDMLCSMTNLLGKYDMDGSQVHEIFFTMPKEKALDKIESYCQSDVINTYWLWLKYQILRGELLLEDYLDILEKFNKDLQGMQKEWVSFFSEKIDEELRRNLKA